MKTINWTKVREDAKVVDISVAQVRAFFDGEDLPEDVHTLLDEAQGEVFSESAEEAYVLIRIS